MDCCFESLMIALAVGADALAAGFACGARGVYISPWAAWAVGALCGGALGLSLQLGGALGRLLPQGAASLAAFGLLLLLGLGHVFAPPGAPPHSSVPAESRPLPPRGALLLAAALSLDSLAVGLAPAIRPLHPWWAALCAGGLGAAALRAAAAAGRCPGTRPAGHCTFLSGVLLILLAFCRL